MQPAKKYFTVSLPCKKHIEKFVQAMLGAGSIRADHSSTLGLFVLVSLEKEIYSSRNINEGFQYKDMQGSIPIQVSQYTWTAIGFELAPEKIVTINRFLENYFKESLYQYCASRVKEAGRFKGYDRLIYDFAEKMGIEVEDDISFEGLKKMEYRYRTKMMEQEGATKVPVLFS